MMHADFFEHLHAQLCKLVVSTRLLAMVVDAPPRVVAVG